MTCRSTSGGGDLDSTLLNSLLNQSISNTAQTQQHLKPSLPGQVVKSRKENCPTEPVKLSPAVTLPSKGTPEAGTPPTSKAADDEN